MTCSTIEETLDHAAFLARHVGKHDLLSAVNAILMELRIPTQYIGYYYLRDAIILSYTRPAWAVTVGLYSEIARLHGPEINSRQVEQAIRSVIEDAWEMRDKQIWCCYFGADRGRPSNMVFITRIGRFLELWQGY